MIRVGVQDLLIGASGGVEVAAVEERPRLFHFGIDLFGSLGVTGAAQLARGGLEQ